MNLAHFINDKCVNKYTNIKYEKEKNLKKYKFFLDNITNYIYITDRLIFIRENDEFIFTLEISEKPYAKMILKEQNYEALLNILDSSYNVKDNIIDFTYMVEGENEHHHIIMKVDD